MLKPSSSRVWHILPPVALFLALALSLYLSKPAYAHGELERSEPTANSVVTKAPKEIVLFMSESVDPAFSEIKVFDSDGLQVDLGDVRVSSDTTLLVGVSPLEPGTYTVVWRVTSVSDSHRTGGSFRFTVSGGGRLFLGTGGGTTSAFIDTRPTLANTAIRWGELVGLALIAGAIGTLVLVWRPVRFDVPYEAQSRLRNRLRVVTFLGLGIVAIALVTDLFHQAGAGSSGGVSFAQSVGDILGGSQFGFLLLMRLILVTGLGLLWYKLLKAEVSPWSWPVWLAVVLSVMLLLGRSLGSHAAASESGSGALNVALDFIHLGAACLWIGGLLALASGFDIVRTLHGRAIVRLVRRFSNLAIVSVSLIALTGLYNAWLEVGSLGAITGTSYGRVLLLKMSILVPLLALAAMNLVGIRLRVSGLKDRAAGATERVGQRLGVLVHGEVILALVIFGLTAVLANLPLGRDEIARSTEADEVPMAMPVLVESHGLNVTLGITPNQVGSNTFLVGLADGLGNTVEGTAEVTLQLSRLDQDIQMEPLVLKPRGRGQYSDGSDALSIVGTWVGGVTIVTEEDSPLTIRYVFRVAGHSQRRVPFVRGIVEFLAGKEPELPRTGPLVSAGADAEAGIALLRRGDASMNSLTSLHECNNINGIITVLDYNSPDRLRYAVLGGGESIIDGSHQWYRRGNAPWRLQQRNEAFSFPDFRYADDATGVRIEGSHLLDNRPHRLVSFYSPRDDAEYWFWIDAENYRISRLLMNVPPSHYMVSIFDDFDGPEVISAPSGTEDDSVTVPLIPKTVPCQNYLP